MADVLRSRRDCPWAHDVAPGVSGIAQLFSYVQLEPNANEVLLLHGTENAEHIVQQGFDDRLSVRGPGRGQGRGQVLAITVSRRCFLGLAVRGGWHQPRSTFNDSKVVRTRRFPLGTPPLPSPPSNPRDRPCPSPAQLYSSSSSM